MYPSAAQTATGSSSPWTTRTLLAILVGAFVLRLWGVGYGLPFPLVSDEEVMIGGAMRMLELRSVLPVLHPDQMAILYYPVVLPYLYMVVFTPFLGILYLANGMPPLSDFAPHIFANIGTIFLLARLTSVVMATLTVYVVYRIGLLMFRRQAIALAAAALMATDFFSVFLGHFARHWSATVLTIWLTVWLACLIRQRGERKHYIWAGLVAAIGFGVSYIGCLGIVAAGIAHIARNGLNRLFVAPAWWMAGIFLLVAGLFAAVYPQPIIRLIAPQGILPIEESKTLPGLIEAAWFYGRTLFYANPVLTVGFAAGLVAAVADGRYWLAIAAAASAAATVVFLYGFMPLEDRYIMPLVPLMALMTGYAAVRLVDRVAGTAMRPFVATGLAALVVFPAAVSAQAAFMLSRNDTRELAKAWVDNNLAPGTRVAVAMNSVKLRATLAALAEQRDLDPGSLKAADRARLKAGKAVSSNKKTYHALHLDQMSRFGTIDVKSADVLAALEQRGYRYLIADYKNPDEITPLHAAARQFGKRLVRITPGEDDDQPPFLRSTLLVTRPMSHLFAYDRFGPVVEIFRLNGGDSPAQ